MDKTMTTYAKKLKKSDKLLNKLKVRSLIMSKVHNCDSIVGLAGPDINNYIDWCNSYKFKNILIYENDRNTFLHQVKNIRKKAKIVYGSITETEPNKENTFYDLDYCCTINSIAPHFARFKKNYSITLSLRSIGAQKTLHKFLYYNNAQILMYDTFETPVKHTIITTTEGEYIYTQYFDTSPMCNISKIDYKP